jgi:integrase
MTYEATKYTGIKASKNTILMDLVIDGVRYRETIKTSPTKATLKSASIRREYIRDKASQGNIDILEYFPKSKKAIRSSPNQGRHMTIEQLLNQYLIRKQKNCSRSTIRGYTKSITSQLIPVFGKLTLNQLKPTMVKDWISSLELNSKAKTINNHLTPLKSAYDDAYHDELIDKNPMLRIKNLKVDKTQPEPFSLLEIEDILAAIKCKSSRNLIEFSFFSGVRTSELIALSWDKVNWVENTILINQAYVCREIKTTKTHAGTRFHELHPRAKKALQNQKKITISGVIFPDPKTGVKWTGDEPIRKRLWTRALKDSGVKYRYPYQTRHTYASHRLSEGKNPLWVAKQMGHEDWGMIRKTYGKWIENCTTENYTVNTNR